MTPSLRSNGIREWIAGPGKVRSPWTIYDVIMPPIVFGMIGWMIVVGVVGKVFGGKVRKCPRETA